MFSKDIISKLLKVKYRTPKRIARIFGSLKTARDIYNSFDAFRNRVNNCLQYSSQTLSLESFLRIQFNNIGINVVNDFSNIEPAFDFWLYENQEPQYTYWLSESADPSYIYWLFEESDITLNFDFIVEVPSALMNREAEIKAAIIKLKLAGKRYKIVYY